MIYLDYAATTPISDKALEIYGHIAKNQYGNPKSLHDVGTIADHSLTASRKTLAELINGDEHGIYFTSGGTESNHLAILSLARAHKEKGKQIITSKMEHASVLQAFELLKKEGFDVRYVPVNAHGIVERDALANLITNETILVSLAYTNGEIGVIQNIEEIGAFLKKRKILFHSDCVQAFGKIEIDTQKANLSSISLASHKIYGPKGVGAVYISPEIKWKALFDDVTHENGFRPGTVNLPGIVSFVYAAEEACEAILSEQNRIQRLRDIFLSCIMDHDKIIVEEHPDSKAQSPYLLGLRLKGVEGQYTMLECNRHGIALSTGSACQIGEHTPSYTMHALGRTIDEAREFIRISFGKYTDEKDCITAANCLNEIVKNRE
ncbi:cysteine desulfurase [Pueribacillus theae]|uniref:Cysteine desulfurase n=1 Tax=Pueribacillus theae TaxID=2171751 RepID=A0A2U1JZP4_9BACI|nr:IscS subfamily cysteine desulfurase [Pueribacillus theae]PWA10720.1 cysteine desulfurase [Pueribacillus theae]